MLAHKIERRSPHAPEFLFALVLDIDNYPDFIPICRAARAFDRKKTGAVEDCTADVAIAYHFISARFTSRVRADHDALTITATHLKGPLTHLDCRWHFVPEGEGCRVSCSVDFAFESHVLQLIAHPIFPHAAGRMVARFEERADYLAAQHVSQSDNLLKK